DGAGRRRRRRCPGEAEGEERRGEQGDRQPQDGKGARAGRAGHGRDGRAAHRQDGTRLSPFSEGPLPGRLRAVPSVTSRTPALASTLPVRDNGGTGGEYPACGG